MTTSTKSNKPVRYINVKVAGINMSIGVFPARASDSDATKAVLNALTKAPIEAVEAFIQEVGIEFVSVKEAVSQATPKQSEALTKLLEAMGVTPDQDESEQISF